MFKRQEKAESSLKGALFRKRLNGERIPVYNYTCFNPQDPNYKKIKDHLNKLEGDENKRKKTWRNCYDVAKDALDAKSKGKFPALNITNYFVGGNPDEHRTKEKAEENKIPSWAYLMKDGVFVLDKNGKRIPRNPVGVVPLKNRKNAYFYNFKNI